MVDVAPLKVRVILDTNVLLSGLLSAGGVPARLVEAWLDHRFILVSHAIQLDELREVTRRDKIRARLKSSEAGRLINQIKAIAEMVGRLPPVERSRDPRDDFLLALCEAGKADLLVTGDKDDLLSLETHGGATIVTAARFAETLRL
ncbi:MAG: putative toxin-antitoxin system toxin component, PIN family [Sphingomonas sp.]|uniref:putative toxin-antitoxin system toxin component, PIN family n=1 Tax=Sphingomonas sp. TaxID=28214 RepID=UPI003564B9F2